MSQNVPVFGLYMAIAILFPILHGALGGAADKPEVDTLDDP